MGELSLLPASTFYSGPFCHEHTITRAPKDVQTFSRMRKEILRSGVHYLMPPKIVDPFMGGMLEPHQGVELYSTIKRPVLIDVQETRPDTILFSFGLAEQPTTQQNILRFLMSRSSEAGREGVDFSLLSDVVGIDTCNINQRSQLYSKTPLVDKFFLYGVGRDYYQPSLDYLRSQLYSKTPLVDIGSSLKDGGVSISGIKPEMKDLLSIVAEFYPSNISAKCRNQIPLFPHPTRMEPSEAWTNIQGSSPKCQTVTVPPIKRHSIPKKIKLNPSPKKKNTRNVGKERDLYRRSQFHACESLLSLILDKKHGNTTMSSLKNSDPELPQLLTQFSAGIAGTGLAVLFSVVCKVSGGRVPFCASKLLNTGFGLGLVWLSWAVNKLRDNIICISKNTSKVRVKDKEMIRRVDKSLNEMFVRAATVMVFAMLRFA